MLVKNEKYDESDSSEYMSSVSGSSFYSQARSTFLRGTGY